MIPTIPNEAPRARAERLLRELLPQYNSRDEALDNLYYVFPIDTPELARRTIAAALYIINTDKAE